MIRKQILSDDKRRDIDFGYRDIVAREGKEQHERDLKRGGGYVTLPTLPEALERKYQAANRQWGWQWVFPHNASFGNRPPVASSGNTFTTPSSSGPSNTRKASEYQTFAHI